MTEQINIRCGEAEQMRRFMHGLSRTERYALLLHYADELTMSEIGLVLDLPEFRVRDMVDRLGAQARKLLQRAA